MLTEMPDAPAETVAPTAESPLLPAELSDPGIVIRKIAGRTYQLRPDGFSDADFRERERMILAQRPAMAERLQEVADLRDTLANQLTGDVPPDVRNEVIEKITTRVLEVVLADATRPRIATLAEERAFGESSTGVAYAVFRAARHDHPEIDGVPAARRILSRISAEEAAALLPALNLAY